MSNETFPVLPGLTWNIERKHEWRNAVRESDSGRSFSRAMWTYPVRHYRLEYEFLRSGAQRELQTLMGFFDRHKGDFDTWLFDDPVDNTAASVQIGLGTGAAQSYQLLRSFGGALSPVFDTYGEVQLSVSDWRGTERLSSKTRQNLMLQSDADSSVSPWFKGANQTRVGKTTAPDGTSTATVYNAATGGNAYIAQSGSLAAAVVYIASIYAKLISGSVPASGSVISIEHDKDGSASTLERTSRDFQGLSNQWQRFSLVFTNASDVVAATRYFMGDWGNGAEIAAWGAQLEPTQLRCGGALVYGTRTTTDPLGGGDTLKLVERPINDAHYLDDHGITIPAGGSLTYDWYFKPAERSLVRLECYPVPTTSTYAVCLVDVANGLVSQVSTAGTAQMSVAIADAGNGWKKLSLSFNPGNAETETIIRAALVTGSFGGLGNTVYQGADGAGMYVWMPSTVLKPSRYIATAAAARALIDYSISGTGLVSLGEPLGAGATLSWSGKYYQRCRFKAGDLSYMQFMDQLFNAKSVEFKTYKP
jgi:hypothetical protein